MEEIQDLVALSDDELLERLGRELWSDTAHATLPTEHLLKLRAREWLTANLPAAKNAVCDNSAVNAIRNKADEVTLAGVIADIFATSLGFPAPSVVSILVVRIGLNRLCAGSTPLRSGSV
jgi:hypothetical protein